LSFGLIATKYYLNICSQLFVTNVKSKWTPIAELTLLLNTFSYAPAILWAMLYNPRHWPYCVFVGILFVVANNLVLYRLTREAHVAGRSNFTSEKRNSSESFVRKFRPWARQMFIYDCFVLGAGLLLAFKIAQDEPIYAIFAVSMNLFQIYAIVLTREAPVVRTGLSRLIFLHRRLDRTPATPAASTLLSPESIQGTRNNL
jgi:hypothetical protein